MSTEPSSPPEADKVEMVRKVYAKDLKEKDRVLTVFRCVRKQKNTSRAGKEFLALTLADRTGELDARIFEQVDRADPTFIASDYVLVEGSVTTFQGRPQLVIERIERLDPEPIDPKEFAPPPPSEATEGARGKTVHQIRELIERVQDPHIRQLLLAFLDDPAISAGLPHAPAAKGVHHAYRGGLAEHLLSVLKLAHRIADHYPMADRDLLIAGALLHDIGKVNELAYEKDKSFDYTDQGRLVGHLVMTAQKIHEKAARIEGFPPLLEHHLTHLVISHHGHLEYGSPKLPMTLEAMLVHLIDLMDSRVASWLELMARDSHDRWTEPTHLVDRHLWKAPLPTVRNRGPVTARSKRPPSAHRERRRRAPDAQKKEEKAETPTSAPPAAAPPPRDASLPKELAFKPFNVLAGDSTEPS